MQMKLSLFCYTVAATDASVPPGRLMTDLEMILCINRENHLQCHMYVYASSVWIMDVLAKSTFYFLAKVSRVYYWRREGDKALFSKWAIKSLVTIKSNGYHQKKVFLYIPYWHDIKERFSLSSKLTYLTSKPYQIENWSEPIFFGCFIRNSLLAWLPSISRPVYPAKQFLCWDDKTTKKAGGKTFLRPLLKISIEKPSNFDNLKPWKKIDYLTAQ